MVAGGLPGLTVLLDDGTGTFPYDISAYVRLKEGYTGTRGRQNELSDIEAGGLALSLDNADGRFTLGSTIIASPSPIKLDRRVRVNATPGANLLTADQGSFETATGGFAFSTLLGARTVGTSLAQSAVRSTDGTKSLLITWSTSASGNYAGISVATVIGQTYTFAADVYVPTGSPNVKLLAAFIGSSAFVTTKDAWARASVTFTATATSTFIGVDQVTSTAGQTCFVDSLALNVGTSALPFAAGGLTVNRFTQHVQNWPTEWPSGDDGFAVAQIALTDVQAKVESDRYPLRSVPEEEAAADGPLATYLLSGPAGAQSAADSSGAQAPALTMVGSGTDVVFGSASILGTASLTSATFAGGKYLQAPALNWLIGGTATINAFECWFSTTTVPAGQMAIASMPGSGVLYIDSAGKVDGAGPVVTDGLRHHVYWGQTNVWVDGVLVAFPGWSSGSYLTLGGGAASSSNFIGTMSMVSIYATAAAGPRIIAHSQAGSTGFAGEPGTARLTRLAGYANVPVGTLDTSLTNVAFEDFTDKAVAEELRNVADAEFGTVFIDGAGSLTFHNRNKAVSKLSPDVTIDANFLDDGTRFECDMQGVLNYFETTAAGTGVTQVVRNTTSEVTNQHGRYKGSKTYLVSTDQEALDRANWVVYTHAEPQPRLGSLTVDLLTMTIAQQAAMLTLEANSWLRVTGLPGQTPGGTTADFIVQGFSESLNAGAWTMTLNVANKAVAAPTPWILDNATYSVLDNTTRLYV